MPKQPPPPLLQQQDLRILFWQRLRRLSLALFLGAAVGWCLYASGLFNWSWLANSLSRLQRILGEAWPPDFDRARTHWVAPLRDTVVMSVTGTALGVAMAVPLAFLAARGLSPHRLIPTPVRLFLGGLRTVPELLLAIIMVVLFGPGMLAGCLALTLHSAGMLGKFYHEIMEHAQPEPLQAVRASGGNRLQVITHGVLPQVFPQLLDVTLFRWECNIRAAVVLGVIGAGGIGIEIILAMRTLKYPEVFALVLVILVMVALVDALSALLRRHLG